MNSKIHQIGLTIFWTEGNHSQKGKGGKRVEVVNSNPEIIKIFLTFLRRFKIDENRLKGRVQVHDKNEVKKAELFWSKISLISRKQFQKPMIKKSKVHKTSTNILPYGTFTVTYNDTKLFLFLSKEVQKMIERMKWDEREYHNSSLNYH